MGVQAPALGIPMPAGPRTGHTRPCPTRFYKQPCVLPPGLQDQGQQRARGLQGGPCGLQPRKNGLSMGFTREGWHGLGWGLQLTQALHLPLPFVHRAPRLPMTWNSTAGPRDQIQTLSGFIGGFWGQRGPPSPENTLAVAGPPDKCVLKHRARVAGALPSPQPSPGPQQGTASPGKASLRPGVPQLCPPTSWWILQTQTADVCF